jgi:hypothetical protein
MGDGALLALFRLVVPRERVETRELLAACVAFEWPETDV